ncbi:hypothetical protein TSUD_165960 [Trifolium subterraneum]|uniref:Ribulose-phosphate 3-epimerase n=1 Tax=Trifolium subterraneum TaxID=3900 RepID=A0A2Z6NAS1_TRISU|nr:hypothetical protein TSUD_165960 [Trifolium subterraneum]
MGVSPKIAPSMLSSDFANLASEAHRMINYGADWLHMDIMAVLSEEISSLSSILFNRAYLDCHLMVTNPLDYVEPLGKAGASGFTFHIETSKDNWKELIQNIKSHGMKPGVAIKPGTSVEEVYPLVRTLRKKYPSLDIEVDGGLGPSTIDAAASAGANCIVAGSSVFGAPEPAQVISLLRNSVEKSQ